MEALLNDPEKIGVIVLLFALVIGFLRGTLGSGITHEKQIAQIRTDYREQLDACEQRTKEWKDLAVRGSFVVKDLANVAADAAKIAKDQG